MGKTSATLGIGGKKKPVETKSGSTNKTPAPKPTQTYSPKNPVTAAPIASAPPPVSTVSEPVSAPVGMASNSLKVGGRDLGKEQQVLQQLGANPIMAGMLDPKSLFEMTYTPEELAGISEYQKIMQTEQARDNLLATPMPTASLLRPLEDALRAKGQIGDQPLGESEIFKAAGVSGYEVLSQSLNQHLNEIDFKYDSFTKELSRVSGSMVDAYNTTASTYKVLRDEYKEKTDQLQSIMTDLMNHEQAIDLMNRQAAINMEAKRLSASLSGGGGSGGGGGSAGSAGSSTPSWMLDIVDQFADGLITEDQAKSRIKAATGLTDSKAADWYDKFYQLINTSNAIRIDDLPLPDFAKDTVNNATGGYIKFLSPKEKNVKPKTEGKKDWRTAT